MVVLSRDAALRALRRTLVAPCTTTVRSLPSEVALEPGTDPVPRRYVASLDSVKAVSLGYLVERMGRLIDGRMRAVRRAGGGRGLLTRTRSHAGSFAGRSMVPPW